MFSRHRRVAQWLERLLDTQEVSGSTPPAPTNDAPRCQQSGSKVRLASHDGVIVPTVRGSIRAQSKDRREPPTTVFMSEISVTLPDGSSRRVPAGSTPADVAAAISPRLAKAALAAVVDGRLVDLTFPLTRTRGRDRHRRVARSAGALSSQHGAPAGRGGDQSLPVARSAESVRRPTRASSTTSSSSARSCPRI